MPTKKVRRPCSYPGANLAKGWVEQSDRDRETWEAGQLFLSLIDQAFVYLSRGKLRSFTKGIARITLHNLSLESIRSLILTLKEDLSL